MCIVESPIGETDKRDDVLAYNAAIAASKIALSRIFQPLAEFALESGLGFHETQEVLREVWVRDTAAKQLLHSKRKNVSGIAAATGISRSEVSRILSTKKRPSANGRQTPAMRIFAAWHELEKYVCSNGRPREIRIYGKGRTFENLVRKYGLGIPVRAILDELIRIGALDVLDNQYVRPKIPVSAMAIPAEKIKLFGERAAEVLNMLKRQMKSDDNANFYAQFRCQQISNKVLPQFSNDDSGKLREIISELDYFFSMRKDNVSSSNKVGPHTIGATAIIALEYVTDGTRDPNKIKLRRNLRRSPKKSSLSH